MSVAVAVVTVVGMLLIVSQRATLPPAAKLSRPNHKPQLARRPEQPFSHCRALFTVLKDDTSNRLWDSGKDIALRWFVIIAIIKGE